MISGNFEVYSADEVDDIGTNGSIVDIGLYALESIEYRSLALIDLTVSLCHIIDLLLGEAGMLAHDNRIDTIEHYRIMSHDHIRRHVTAYACAALDENKFTNTALFMNNSAR